MDEALQKLVVLQSDYQPSPATAAQLHDKTIVMFVAPASTGKTLLMNEIAARHADFKRVPVFTTRARRSDDDPGMFRYLPHDDSHVKEILRQAREGELVQFAVHPSGRLYGTEPQDYPGLFNILATLSSAVRPIQQLPFQQTIVVGVVTEAKRWQKWFQKRFPAKHPDRAKRLVEAITSLEWLLAQEPSKVLWAINLPDKQAQTATELIETILYTKEKSDGRQYAESMLKMAKEIST